MNTQLNSQEMVQNAFDKLFSERSPEEKIEADARLIMFRFLDIIERKREYLGMSRKELAHKVGTSPSYITQLFRGDKFINMSMLAKMQNVLSIEFEITGKNDEKKPGNSYQNMDSDLRFVFEKD